MRTSIRNKRPIWVRPYLGITQLSDAEGNLTGEYEVKYDLPSRVMANVTPAKGQAALEIFGNSEEYDKIALIDCTEDIVFSPHDYDGMLTDGGNLFGVGRITENAVFFVDTSPDESGNDGYDYIVRRIAKAFNSVAIALKRINGESEDVQTYSH